MSKSSQKPTSGGYSKYVDGVNEEAMDTFLSALRSGDWAQGQGVLESRQGKFCCLGVACKLFHEACGVERTEPTNTRFTEYGGSSTSLPVEIADYLGIPPTNRTYVGDRLDTDVKFLKQQATGLVHENTAVLWNDHFDKTFSEIADAFEKEFTRE